MSVFLKDLETLKTEFKNKQLYSSSALIANSVFWAEFDRKVDIAGIRSQIIHSTDRKALDEQKEKARMVELKLQEAKEEARRRDREIEDAKKEAELRKEQLRLAQIEIEKSK